MEHNPNQLFQALPTPHAVQQRIQEIRQHAIMAFLRIGVVMGVMARRLEKPNSLQEIDDDSVFCGCAVGPFVNLVRI